MWPTAIIAALLIVGQGGQVAETQAQKDARMKWWREARFGMFIHWGLYSIPAGEWGNSKTHAEWIMETAKIPVEEYEKLLARFNPVKFDANAWAKMAKDAGMQYMVITTKHHDGFALFDSKTSNYDVMATPFKRDIMKELSTAVRAQGLTMGWYHSIMDWNHPAYVPARPWNSRQDPSRKNLDDYVPYLRSQVTELLTNYGPIGVMWFDGEWESTWNDGYGKPLYELCRKLQPKVIVNNRVSNSRAGSMESAGNDQRVGDFSTPEQYIPPTGIPGADWETCMTMNDYWGWNKSDRNWKSTRQIIENLVDIASKGGNYLLNVGPRDDGTFPDEAVERLKGIGNWMKVNGDSIYGTTASVFENLPWGRSTTKRNGKDTILYLQVLERPLDRKIVVPGIGNVPKRARLLGGKDLKVSRAGSDLIIEAAGPVPDLPEVIALEVSGAPIIFRTPRIESPSDMLVNALVVTIPPAGPEQEVRFTLDGRDPSATSGLYKLPIKLSESTTVKAATFHKGKRVSAVAQRSFQKVKPWPDLKIFKADPGLQLAEYPGNWDKLPDFSNLKPRSSTIATQIGPAGAGGTMEEFVARRYTGFISVPESDAYLFSLTSDDGARLWIDGKLVVDNDGLHSSDTKTGVAPLAAGYHSIEIAWFNKTGGAALELKWARSGKKSEVVPAKAYVH
ncbi:MAG: alpha-L-fucosidase [Fimbriimonadaceae bacterium]